jgi:hypothetical protein
MSATPQPMCPKHHIALVTRQGLTRRKCKLCPRRLSHRNLSGICVDCQRRMHLQAPRKSKKTRQLLACPACVGEVTSERKARASRANGRKGGPPMSKRLCRLCGKKPLAPRNESGVCRDCQRIHDKPKPEAK